MKKLILFSLQLLLLNITVLAQKYTTLKSGSWDDKGIWSLNGTSFCDCSPGSVLSNDTIIVNHDVQTTANLSLTGSSNMKVSNTGSISNSLFDIEVNNSIFNSEGAISINKLVVNTGGKFEIASTSLIVNARMLIYGAFTTNNSNISVMNGNIEVYQGGQVFIGGSTDIFFNRGNYQNAGTTFICNTCCLYLSQGNVTNSASGRFEGGGAVISEIGNIKNSGSWDPSLRWCAAGTDFNVPSIEDCANANEICKSQPLPQELIAFGGYSTDDGNVLFWKTASEASGDKYNLESSLDGKNWRYLDEVQSVNPEGLISSYTYVHREKGKGLQYYRITLLNQSGEEMFTKTTSIVSSFDHEILVFPNPANEFATVRLQENHKFSTLKLYDASGRLIVEREIGTEFNIDLDLPAQEGLYFLQAEGEYSTEKIPLIKI